MRSRAEEEHGLPPLRLLRVLWAGLWIAYGLWVLRSGVRTSVDTTLYERWMDLLIAKSFNISSYLNEQNFQNPPILYVGWITLAASLKVMLGASWMKAIVFLNWLAFGAGSYAVLNAVRRMTASAASLLLAAFLFVTAGDLLIFIPFVLSDLIFWVMASVTLVAGCLLATESDHARAVPTAVAGSLLVLAALFFRPGGLTLVVFWIAALASWFARGAFDRFATAIIATVVSLALAAIAWHAAIAIDPGAWPFGGLSNFFAVIARQYRDGVLVLAPESDLMVEPAVTWIGAVRLTAQKLLFFLTPWLPSYSRVHTLMNLAFFLPAYGLTIAAVMNRARLTEAQRRAVLILVLFVFTSAVSHALVPLDYDHRYRLPLLPALVMLAAIGLESVRRPQTLASIPQAK